MADKRVQKSNARLWQELRNELLNLQIACEQWELGNYEQSTMMAKCIRVLLYDHGTSRSLFSQLNLKNYPFFSTPELVEIDSVKRPCAILAKLTGTLWETANCPDKVTARWKPQYYSAGVRSGSDRTARIAFRRIPFIEWWSEVVLWNGAHRMSREELVLSLCNELGGTHSAVMLSPKAAALLANAYTIGTATMISMNGHSLVPVNTNYDAVVRQIAYELQATVKRNFGKKVENMSIVPPIPEDWRDVEGPWGSVRMNHEYLQEVLVGLERSGQGDTMMAKDIRSEDYWSQYKKRLKKSGIL